MLPFITSFTCARLGILSVNSIGSEYTRAVSAYVILSKNSLRDVMGAYVCMSLCIYNI